MLSVSTPEHETTGPPPRLVCTFPNWNLNPYLRMLTGEAQERGWAFIGGTTVDHLMRDIAALNAGDVVHLHWTGPFSVGVDDESEVHARIAAFRDLMVRRQADGVRFIWTVHNVMAHDALYPNSEVHLATVLAELAETIIIHNGHTRDAVGDLFPLPDSKVVHIPHSSYSGVFPFPDTTAEARSILGIPPGPPVAGLIGAIRPYKGVGRLLAASALAACDLPGLSVAVAGWVDPASRPEIEAHLPPTLPLYMKDARLSDAEIAAWTKACDILVLPYTNILNSGSMLMAASAGVPVVVPDLPHLVAEYGGQEWVTFFAGSQQGDRAASELASAMKHAMDTRDSGSAAALTFARASPPHDMALRYAAVLDGDGNGGQPVSS